MAKSFFKTLAQDLLTLEINTIIKADMSAAKMPPSRRQALYELCVVYHKKLEELNVRDPVYWSFAGIRSFGELRDCAKNGIERFEKGLQAASKDEQEAIGEKLKILERIQEQSSKIVNMFYELRNRAKDKRNQVEGYFDVPESIKREVLTEMRKKGGLKPAEAHKESENWNNDIDRYRMNEIEDLDLTAEQVALIRKAWEIGTERIVLQTVIQIDGDVTTRISERFARNLNNTVLQIHNDSIDTSTRFWSSIMKALGEIAGKAFGVILGK